MQVQGLVSVRVSDGFGNQLFMVAAMLGYAEKHNMIPVFYETPMVSKDHASSALKIQELFPQIRTLTESERSARWCEIEMHWDDGFRYIDLPAPPEDANILLRGYFQSPKYFPIAGVHLNLLPRLGLTCLELLEHPWDSMGFLHIRRGDYMHPFNRHHVIDMPTYIRKCFEQDHSETEVFFVASDDIAWCKQALPVLFPHKRFIWCPEEATDAETLYWMTLCGRGGVCANSTFSWWAAYFGCQSGNVGARYCMPYPWGFPPLPEAYDLYPEWAHRVDTR